MKQILQLPLFQHFKYLVIAYILVFVLFTLKIVLFEMPADSYVCFRQSFFHLIEYKNLYLLYPDEYQTDYNYGPLFASLMFFWAYLPDEIGIFLWNGAHLCAYLLALFFLPFEQKAKVFIGWFCLQEYITSMQNVQTNPTIAALILLTAIYQSKEKPVLSSLFLVFGIFFKVYVVTAGVWWIIGKQKMRFLLFGLGWAVLFFLIPLVWVDIEQLLFLYEQWWQKMQHHSQRNSLSIIGLLQILSPSIQQLYIMAFGLIVTLGLLFKQSIYKSGPHQWLFLAQLLLFTILFNPASESPTYLIAVTGVAIWWWFSERAKLDQFLLIFVLLCTSFITTDLVPVNWRTNYVYPYHLKAIPCILVWAKLTYDLYLSSSTRPSVA
jgi:hypothetical protein